MNQRQKRNKIANIRKEQKLAKMTKRPQARKPMTQQEIEWMAIFVQKCVNSDKEALEICSAKIQRSKRLGKILSPIFILWGLALGWDTVFAVMGIVLALVPWLECFLYRDSLSFWKDQLRENSEYLQELNLRLATS